MKFPLKLCGSLLVTISLVLGTYAASTAYLVPIDSIQFAAGQSATADDAVTLHAPAGRDDSIPPQPILRPGPQDAPLTLTAEHLALLRDAGVDRVHVKEFSFGRWRERWLFVLAVIGLAVGALMLRAAQRSEVQAAAASVTVHSPDALLDSALSIARGVRDELEGTPATPAATTKLAKSIERMQAECFDPFVDCRPVIVEKFGMAGYAQLMDRFAAAERQFNRSWSAAADHVAAEATECFGNGIVLLEEARARLDPK